MAIFVVISFGGANAEKLPANIARLFPTTHLLISDTSWLVSGPVTAKNVSDTLGISLGESGTGVVLQIAGDYFGRASPGIWAWLKATLEASGGKG